MELNTTILTAFIIAICIIPYILMRRSRKKREEQLLQAVINIAKQHNCNITQKEIFGNLVISIAENENALIFYRQENDQETEKYIDLSEIRRCETLISRRAVELKNSSDTIIDKLKLNFVHLDIKKPDILLEFYNSNESFQLSGELQLIEKWEKIIKGRLTA